MNLKASLCLLTLVALAVVLALPGCNQKDPLVAPESAVTANATAPSVSLDANEIDLVEKMSQNRLAYKTYLEALRDYYIKHGMYDKQKLAEKELAGYRKYMKYSYLLLADVPPANLTRPEEKIAAADTLFEDGMNYFKQGRLKGAPGIFNREKLLLAVDKFETLIKQYPTSDKVDDAFFNAAEILKEYFNENDKAVEYYKRAYTADPKTPHPAHFQRAVVLDYRLHKRDEAVAEYDAVIKFESGPQYPSTNAPFAASRMKELKGEK